MRLNMEGILIPRSQIDTFEDINFTTNRPVFAICMLAIAAKLPGTWWLTSKQSWPNRTPVRCMGSIHDPYCANIVHGFRVQFG